MNKTQRTPNSISAKTISVYSSVLGMLALRGKPWFLLEGCTKTAMTSENKVWCQLLEGNRRFAEGKSRFNGYSIDLRKSLVDEQHPHTVIVSCSDSRVPPEIVFDAQLGELFSVRTAGPTLDDMVSASIEFGVVKLGIRHVVVMSHTNCGAVAAAMDALDSGETVAEENISSTIEGLDADAIIGAGGMIVTGSSVITTEAHGDGEHHSPSGLLAKTEFTRVVAENPEAESYLPGIVARVAPIVAEARHDGLVDPSDYSRRNAQFVAHKLREMPALTGLWQAGELTIRAALYHLESGLVEELEM